ncbi:Uma2 family endonuclease [Desulfobacterales bacterium HSG2]|nr:Uma2 family endonuclease [Desulfobacterales bacterium HSG2]
MNPSCHHAYIAGNLITAFNNLKKYSVFSELTLEIGGKEHIPDICLYPKRKIDFSVDDIIRMKEMPLLTVEILSPTQGSQEALDKFKIYFGAGIKSCWLVVPITRSVIVYSEAEKYQRFHTGDVVDGVLDIHLPIEDIFA